MVRLYVGGLDAEVTEELLAGRFKSFGTVTSCEVARNKPGCTDGPAGGCRGFAHVDLEPSGEQALHRCLSTYNGCRWRGGVLRVEKARPDFAATLQQEWQDDAEAEAAAAQAAAEGQQQHVLPPTDGSTVRLMRPDGKKAVISTTTPGPGSRTLFPPFKDVPLNRLSWALPAS